MLLILLHVSSLSSYVSLKIMVFLIKTLFYARGKPVLLPVIGCNSEIIEASQGDYITCISMDFPGNFFLPQKLGKWTQNGSKTGFFEFIGKLSH